MSTAILTNIDERGVATVTLNRPEKHNAFDDAMIAELNACFTELGNSANVRAVVVAAEGKNFCAGADLNWMRRMAGYSYEDNLRDAEALATLLHTLNTLPKLTIAKAHGNVMGGGVGLVACCDIVVATKLTYFTLSEAKIGLIPATISPYVIEAIGARAARRYFCTAERFSANKAKRLGLVSVLDDEEKQDARVALILEKALRNSPQAITASKQLIATVANSPIDANLMKYTSEQIASIRASEEGREGLTAFLEKRNPNWVIED